MKLNEIRNRLMTMEDTDVRQEVANLCDIVATLEAKIEALENPEEAGLMADYKQKYKKLNAL